MKSTKQVRAREGDLGMQGNVRGYPMPILGAGTLGWLIRLRWWAVAGQTVTVLVVHGMLHIHLPVLVLLMLISITAISNAAGALRVIRNQEDQPRWLPCALVSTDILVLTALLAFTGGPGNPFASFFLVYATMAALVLSVRETWLVWTLSSIGYASLFLFRDRLPQLHHDQLCGPAMNYDLHLHGMLIALVLTSGAIAYFVNNILGAFREQQALLNDARKREEENERFASLATLAAGVAHEIGSPLGTIAIAASELRRAAAGQNPEDNQAIREDAELISEEVGRCRQILDRLSDRSGAMGDTPRLLNLEELVKGVKQMIHPEHVARLVVQFPTNKVGSGGVLAPPLALAQALGVLIKNAAEASPGGDPIQLRIELRQGVTRFLVIDSGAGMESSVLTHAGEPFFTTKEPGRGMGLGLYLVRLLAERLQGSFQLKSDQARGTIAMLELPTHASS